MKRYIFKAFLITIGLLSILQACKNLDPNDDIPLVTVKETVFYEKNELVVIYNNPPTSVTRNIIKGIIESEVPDVTFDSIRPCSECDLYVELWVGENIHSYIQGLVSGTRGSSGAEGEDVALYSLNIKSTLPFDKHGSSLLTNNVENNTIGDEIIVAVLDTGIDPIKIDNSYFWKSTGNCYPTGIDDNADRHGTVVSQFIINQFIASPKNFVRIMNLKTHKASGEGTLFDIICAIRFAKENGANIVNASWKLEFNNGSHPYLDSLITYELKQAGILFFAAAGNNEPEANRYIDENKFYPAILSNPSNNVFTVTTTNGDYVSSTQNFSSNHVDLGVLADKYEDDKMLFQIPFESENPIFYISGSSYATPIASGKIGSFFPKGKYSAIPSMEKEEILDHISGPDGNSFIETSSNLVNFIRKGRYIKK